VKETYFKTKYMSAGILLNVKAMVYIKFKLQFRNNNYCYVTVHLHRGLH